MINLDAILDQLNSVVDEKQLKLDLREIGCQVYATGSQVTCNPPPGDASDVDYLVYTSKSLDKLLKYLEENSFEVEGSPEYDIHNSQFASFRKGKVNLIVTNSIDFCMNHRLATEVCKKLNLLEKSDRIMVFKAILYKEGPDNNG